MQAQDIEPEDVWDIYHTFQDQFGRNDWFECYEDNTGRWVIGVNGEVLTTDLVGVKILARKFEGLLQKIEDYQEMESRKALEGRGK